jgi:hypothetical protein
VLDRLQIHRSLHIFSNYISGEMGEFTVLQFVCTLKDRSIEDFDNFGPELLKKMFALSLFGMSESWRRFCLTVMGCPATTFALLGMPLPQFLDRVTEINQMKAECPECVDLEFTDVLLTYLAGIHNQSHTIQEIMYNKSQSFLSDIGVYAAISSDLVECRNGHVQEVTHKFRGKNKFLQRVVEESLLNDIAADHGNIIEAVKPYYLPPSHGNITCRAGQKHDSDQTAEQTRLDNVLARKPRNLCGLLVVLPNLFFEYIMTKDKLCVLASVDFAYSL